ncbi:hypothetical protein [Paenibacillus brevis]|uniref:Lipoprotein n=1 Tax=Paenibacillus brevis TaxID=2841508 RepID=A0ABS6FRI5_9BACL|nr:hypothetical protein [Paenibacillus brevis]MBU5671745.1 hypothetical protein [Paenibacillus brevis]
MMKKVYFTLTIVCVFTLTACQGMDQTPPNNTTQTGQTNSSNIGELNGDHRSNESQNESNYGNAASPNNTSDSRHEEEGPVKETQYSSKETAVNAIENYYEIEQTNVDLGHGIKGHAEGAAGHQYISWNEGKWLIEVNFPTDPEYAVDDYDNGEAMAKAIVSYLEDHFLPPPDERGKIQINGFREHPETIIQWQEGTKVYVIDQKTADPLDTLQIAVKQANKK